MLCIFSDISCTIDSVLVVCLWVVEASKKALGVCDPSRFASLVQLAEMSFWALHVFTFLLAALPCFAVCKGKKKGIVKDRGKGRKCKGECKGETDGKASVGPYRVSNKCLKELRGPSEALPV